MRSMQALLGAVLLVAALARPAQAKCISWTPGGPTVTLSDYECLCDHGRPRAPFPGLPEECRRYEAAQHPAPQEHGVDRAAALYGAALVLGASAIALARLVRPRSKKCAAA